MMPNTPSAPMKRWRSDGPVDDLGTARVRKTSPVPAPWGTIGAPSLRATSTTLTTSAADRGVTATIARVGGRSSGSFDTAGPQATPRYPASRLGSVTTRSAPRASSRVAATLSATSVKTISPSHDLLLEQTALLKDYARIGSPLPPKTSLAPNPRALSLR